MSRPKSKSHSSWLGLISGDIRLNQRSFNTRSWESPILFKRRHFMLLCSVDISFVNLTYWLPKPYNYKNCSYNACCRDSCPCRCWGQCRRWKYLILCMVYVRYGKIQGQWALQNTKEWPCILPCLPWSICQSKYSNRAHCCFNKLHYVNALKS